MLSPFYSQGFTFCLLAKLPVSHECAIVLWYFWVSSSGLFFPFPTDRIRMLEKNVQALHLNTYAVEHTFLTREDCCTSSLLCLNREFEHKGRESAKYKAGTVLWSSHFQPPNVDFVTPSWETPSFNNSTMQKSWSTNHFFIFFFQEVSLSFFTWSSAIVL